MAISGLFFILTRAFQLFTLIPIIGILSYFVHNYVKINALTPTYILVLFIVSVLAAAWSLATLLLYASARHSAAVVAAFDLAFVGAFIASVYLLRGPGTQTNCINVDGYANSNGIGVAYNGNKDCTLLKAAFALGIIECILFFWSFVLALLVARNHREKTVVKRSYHSSRHSHHHQGGSRRSSYDQGRRRSGSQRRSSRTRSYYV